MKPQWIEVISKAHHEHRTLAMNVPGGCILNYCGYMTFCPGVAVEKDEAQADGYAFRSTVTEDMDKALEPFRRLIALFQGMPGFPLQSKPD